MHSLQITDRNALNILKDMINNQGFYALAILNYPNSYLSIVRLPEFKNPIPSKILGSLENNPGYVLTNPANKYEVFMTY